MKYRILNHINILAAALVLYCACSDELVSSEPSVPADSGEVINVGADVDGMVVSSVVSRAIDDPNAAEKVYWLVQPLKQGLDITYGNLNNGQKTNPRVAILRLQSKTGGTESEYETDAESGFAKYTFYYRSDVNGTETNEPAHWYDNGLHFFEGVHVPNRIRYNTNPSELETETDGAQEKRTINGADVKIVKGLTTDQSGDTSTGTDDDLSNYYLLSHYLGMPANTQIAATVARIKLPFRHRLARVLAYILIDPELKTNGVPAKIQGYQLVNGKDNPVTSDIRFCNVDVLEGVHDVYNSQTQVHTLTPKWEEKVRKVVPHFTEQLESFKVYDSDKKTYFQGTSNFPASKPAGFEEINYTNVPVYDLIVRPTYTSTNNVMYDEDLTGTTKQAIAAKKNQIFFTVSLDNGLTYEKHFEFDLDANYQTKVYLRITREGVSYKESGSELWIESSHDDLWYGVDNQNGQTLSEAGSSWQRAYYNTRLNADDKITDGGFYDENTQGEDGTPGQYVTDATWIKNFAQAYQGGEHHGDYFVLAKDLTIDARSLPDDFVFTGHLDGFNTHGTRGYHTLTVTNLGEPWKEYIETKDYTISPLYDTKPDGFTNDLTTPFSLPTLYTRSELKYEYYTQDECDDHNAGLTGAVKEGDEKEPARLYTYDEYSELNPKPYKTITEEQFNDLDESVKKKTEEVNYTYSEFIDLPLTQELFDKLPEVLKTKPAVPYTAEEAKEYNATLDGAWKFGVDYKRAYYDYTEATELTIQQVSVGEYYKKISEDNYERYYLPTLYKVVDRQSGTALFAGLNGIYTTKQEEEETAGNPIYKQNWQWEANVHKEGNYWLPYRDVTGDAATNTGWRAEVMNLKVIGCKMFKDGAVITGNVQNCQYIIDGTTTAVEDHTPAYPKYK